MALSTFSEKEEITQNRNIVEPLEYVPTGWAVTARPDETLFVREARDHDIQKTPNY
jgi:hypothetical protein